MRLLTATELNYTRVSYIIHYCEQNTIGNFRLGCISAWGRIMGLGPEFTIAVAEDGGANRDEVFGA